MRARIVLSFLLAASTFGSAALAVDRGYSVQDFDRIRVEGPYDVRVHVGPPSTAHATGPQLELDRLIISADDGVLVVRPDHNAWGGWPGDRSGQPVIVEVTTRALRGVTLAGSGSVAVDQMRAQQVQLAVTGSGDIGVAALAADEVAVIVAGSGDMKLAGHARAARVTLQGSGDVTAPGLAVQDVVVSSAGSGDLSLSASRSAKISTAGSGDVRIMGTATCSVTRAGSGDVSCGHGG